MGAFWQLLARDIQLALREGGALGTALGFYLLVVALLPLGLGPDLNLLSRIAPGLLWIALLLAALLSLGRIFETDNDDGSLEVMALGGLPLELVTAAKALAHWITTGIPLALLAPLLGILLNLDLSAYGPLVLTMLAGTPAISFLGAVGAALTLRARRGGLLLALLVLPLFIPTLIYGITAISAVTTNVDGGFGASLAILTAVSIGSMVLGPVASAAALRIQMQ
ncbi:MAG: heme exporter protein CcmB [Pseudomonadota bacterium]